ncbi:hypothetical protein [Herminiimonas contaminans]|uniref:DUF1997 domain-containing protein n=1 Tax=Herminiimonas contaminans TaxID=1111140 RepID=A0ABS0EXD5_9BURK|nr:hypothetical protein [Herminiimonas contaminans]MBF8177808.1 hypothetical protein [Herminiimonas contaminans]
MASSEVTICNMALGRVAISRYIASLDERSQQASNCKLFYEPCRDLVLTDYDWNFATKRQQLSNLGNPPKNWAFKYAVPSDCLKARHLTVVGMREPDAKHRIEFELSVEGEAKVLYTDQSLAELVYTRRVTDPNLFSPQFASAVAWKLAGEIALPLSALASLAKTAVQMYQYEIAIAGTTSMNEGQEGQEPESEFIRGRG